MTLKKRAYLLYLESPHWKALREQAFERDGYKCVRCPSSRKLRGHHKTYRKDLTACTVDDIETLCEECHNKHHKEKAKLRREERKLRRANRLVWLICNFGDSTFKFDYQSTLYNE